VTLGATIRNQGTNDASSSTFGFYFSTNTVFDASDVLIGTSTGGVLGAGQQAPRSSIYTVPPSAVGTYYLLAVADPLNAVSESNEQNNVAVFATPITVNAGSIDIVVSQPRVFSSPAAAGGTVNLTCFNQNTGTVTAPGHDMGVFLSTDATFSTNDVLLNYTSVSSMAPGFGTTRSINNVVIPRTTPLGTYYVIFVADLLNQVIETNKQNNVAVTQLLIDRTLPVREQAGGYAIDVFPNPTSTSTVAVQFAGAGVNTTAELTLYNSLGQKISQQQLDLRSTAATATFSTGQLSRGVYILHAVGKGLNVTRRIVVE
jgi:subtilase family serine protease